MGLLHLLCVILYSIIVISLLISYDLFVKNFKKLHLRYSFKIIIGLILFVSQMYFIIRECKIFCVNRKKEVPSVE